MSKDFGWGGFSEMERKMPNKSMQDKKIPCPFCKKRFKWSHLCRMEDSGRKKDYGITRGYALKEGVKNA